MAGGVGVDMYFWELSGWLRDEDLIVLEWDIYSWDLNGQLRDGGS